MGARTKCDDKNTRHTKGRALKTSIIQPRLDLADREGHITNNKNYRKRTKSEFASRVERTRVRMQAALWVLPENKSVGSVRNWLSGALLAGATVGVGEGPLSGVTVGLGGRTQLWDSAIKEQILYREHSVLVLS